MVFFVSARTVHICEERLKCYHGEYVQGVKPHLFGHSMSSMVSGRGTPLVSGNRRTSPPATNARAPVRVNIDFTNLTLELEHAQHHILWPGVSCIYCEGEPVKVMLRYDQWKTLLIVAVNTNTRVKILNTIEYNKIQ